MVLRLRSVSTPSFSHSAKGLYHPCQTHVEMYTDELEFHANAFLMSIYVHFRCRGESTSRTSQRCFPHPDIWWSDKIRVCQRIRNSNLAVESSSFSCDIWSQRACHPCFTFCFHDLMHQTDVLSKKVKSIEIRSHNHPSNLLVTLMTYTFTPLAVAFITQAALRHQEQQHQAPFIEGNQRTTTMLSVLPPLNPTTTTPSIESDVILEPPSRMETHSLRKKLVSRHRFLHSRSSTPPPPAILHHTTPPGCTNQAPSATNSPLFFPRRYRNSTTALAPTRLMMTVTPHG